MNRRSGFGLFWAFATLVIAAIVGGIAYHVGQTATVVTTSPGGTVVYPGYYGGFGFFPVFGLIFFVIILFALFRRPWGYGRWGGHHGHYGGHGEGSVPPVIDAKLKDWHQRAHGETPTNPPAGHSEERPTSA
jgi:hypothetical protein